MSNRIRVTTELDIEQGDRHDIIEAVNEALANVAGFVADTVIIEGVEGSVKIDKVGAHAHFHDSDSQYCDECVRLSQQQLPSLD